MIKISRVKRFTDSLVDLKMGRLMDSKNIIITWSSLKWFIPLIFLKREPELSSPRSPFSSSSIATLAVESDLRKRCWRSPLPLARSIYVLKSNYSNPGVLALFICCYIFLFLSSLSSLHTKRWASSFFFCLKNSFLAYVTACRLTYAQIEKRAV